jgi:hypothetical protein
VTFSDAETGLRPAKPWEKRSTGAPKGNRNAKKAGLYGRDAGHVDMRTRLDKATVATIAAIEADLGGREELSAQKLVILESIRRRLKIVLKVDEFIDGRLIVDKKKRSLIPVVQQQMSTLESIRRDLVDLGLERFKKPEPLEDYLKRRVHRPAKARTARARKEADMADNRTDRNPILACPLWETACWLDDAARPGHCVGQHDQLLSSDPSAGASRLAV